MKYPCDKAKSEDINGLQVYGFKYSEILDIVWLSDFRIFKNGVPISGTRTGKMAAVSGPGTL
jgi:hypothetical protein